VTIHLPLPQLPRFNPSAKLIVLAFALVVIARSKVALFGWDVPLPALLLAFWVVACATVIAIVVIVRRPRRAVTGTGAGS
jgi:hypothetical protein